MTYDPESARYAPRRAFVNCRTCHELIGIAGAGIGEFTCGKCASAKAENMTDKQAQLHPAPLSPSAEGGGFGGSDADKDHLRLRINPERRPADLRPLDHDQKDSANK